MKIELHTLYWNNGKYLIDSQKKVMDHFKINVNYHNIDGIPHGYWMDQVLENSKSEIIGFIDSDCIPLNYDIIDYAISYVSHTRSFIGLAQASNHIFPYYHIFAAPSFFFIWKDTWFGLNKPSFLESKRSDVAEEVSYIAEENKLPYKALFPSSFEKEPLEGVWRLGNYGYYGIGTVFENSVYHLYQGRYKQNADLFSKRCEEVISGKFSTNGMFDCKAEYAGKICR